VAVRPPELLSNNLKDPLAAALDYELAADMAYSLGQAGKRVERELAALAQMRVDDPNRLEALESCARAVHAYLIQREICGMCRHDAIIREMGIPQSVLVRLGASVAYSGAKPSRSHPRDIVPSWVSLRWTSTRSALMSISTQSGDSACG
jgi:hypothetical protein